MSDQTPNPMAEYNALAARFIELANQMSQEGKSAAMVNAALMSASGIYATFVAAGNTGYLKTSGINKVTAVYRQNLVNVQKFKEQQAKASGLTEVKPDQKV